VTFLAIIRPGLNSYTDTFLFALFWELNSLLDIGRDVPTECIMQVPDKIVPVLLIKRHECPPHHNKLNLINIMPNFFKLLNPVPCLNVGVVSGSDGSHWGRLVSSVGLSGVLKVTIRSTWTVNTDVSSGSNMRASMRLAHYCNYCNTWGGSYGFGLE